MADSWTMFEKKILKENVERYINKYIICELLYIDPCPVFNFRMWSIKGCMLFRLIIKKKSLIIWLIFAFFRNPTPGKIINRPEGDDVYHGVVKDYTGLEVASTLQALVFNSWICLGWFCSNKILLKVCIYNVAHVSAAKITFPWGWEGWIPNLRVKLMKKALDLPSQHPHPQHWRLSLGPLPPYTCSGFICNTGYLL